MTYSKLAPGIEMACTAIGQEHGVLLDRRWGVCPRRARDTQTARSQRRGE